MSFEVEELLDQCFNIPLVIEFVRWMQRFLGRVESLTQFIYWLSCVLWATQGIEKLLDKLTVISHSDQNKYRHTTWKPHFKAE